VLPKLTVVLKSAVEEFRMAAASATKLVSAGYVSAYCTEAIIASISEPSSWPLAT
jgi:hypothetical protein